MSQETIFDRGGRSNGTGPGGRASRSSAPRRALLCAAGAIALLLATCAVALGASPRTNAAYLARGSHKTVLRFHTSAHGRISTFNFGGACIGRASWFFNSHGERAIRVSSGGAFSLRRTERDVTPPGGKGTPLTGTFTFTISGRFGRGGTVSGHLSFVSSSAHGVNCRTGTVAFHGRVT